MLIGGFIGFVLAFSVSLIAGKNLEDAVFNATIGCVITALLFRLFRYIIDYCAKQVVAEKARLRDMEQASPLETSPPTEPAPENSAQSAT